MDYGPDGSVVVQTPLSMSRVSAEELSPDAADVVRLVRLTLGGDSSAFEQIILPSGPSLLARRDCILPRLVAQPVCVARPPKGSTLTGSGIASTYGRARSPREH